MVPPVGEQLPPPRPVSAVTASAENPPNETKEKLTDANPNTKWLAFAPTGWVAMKLAEPDLMQAAQRNIIHKNNASRKVSRLTHQIAKLAK